MCCLWSTSLLTMSICAGVVVAVAFQQVDAAPDAEAAAKCDNEGLKNADSKSVSKASKNRSRIIFCERRVSTKATNIKHIRYT